MIQKRKSSEGSGPLSRTKPPSNSCYKVASFAQAEPWSLRVTEKQAQQPGCWIAGVTLNFGGCSTKSPRSLHRAQTRGRPAALWRLLWAGRGGAAPGAACPSRTETPRGKNAGKKGGRSAGFLYCSAGLCAVSSASTLCIFRQNLLSFHCHVNG